MKSKNRLKIILIIATELLIIIVVRYAIYKHDLNEQIQYEAIQRAELRHEADQNEKLIYESEQNAELEYELMLRTIEENSEYYINFSKKFLSEFKKSGYEQKNPNFRSFSLENIVDKFENEINSELVGIDSEVRNEIGIIYVQSKYPDDIRIINNFNENGTPQYEIYYYWIVCFPDDYISDEIIDALNKDIYSIDLKNVKDNLFLASYTPLYV